MASRAIIRRGASRPRVQVGGETVVPPIHPEHAYVGPDGYRSIDMEASVFEREEDHAIVYSEVLEPDPVAVVVELTAEGVEWLLEELERHNRDDRFVRSLAYARDLAKVVAWERAARRAD